jgi:surface polysaccharide O-acyltransferase-like enzyme
MWRTDTYWFDVAVISFLLMLGQLFFGRFSEHQPRWRRLLKSLVGIALVVGTAVLFGRAWSWALIGAIVIAVLVVHGWWLPSKGVNGWTAEPRHRYNELLGLDERGKQR